MLAPFRDFIDIPSQKQIEETYLERRFQDETMVCSEETLDEILLRYLKFNRHANSYTWKYFGQKLMMKQTLATNGIPDKDFKADRLRLNNEDYYPIIDLYFNDDLTEM
ncbi:cytochrome b5 domain-containing protein 1 [Caerostris extrusa]|uniref:Cytochrome b5 domain-containing protein 1 n=1 Tax=Caerostris extrusa TaxID=172846 RepID=A0AAV4SVQ5_CAEEX|nr:cytochrome b5 domain-containing protein 1 [Caerostris extrusa]